MQTFVPYPDIDMCAAVLDRQRLGKQRVEVLQLLKALLGGNKGWASHPAAKMWQGYENALVWYGLAICQEWILRGYNDTCYGKILAYVDTEGEMPPPMPPWWGRVDVHISHQSNLVRKDPEHYRQFFHDVPDDIDYVWPVND